ncbi:MAG: DUF4082 domain-containing protein, partial [Planctomycetes bacterium]|nr:DUF4082 domain-containing protein [Planctomycetota bacterium]
MKNFAWSAGLLLTILFASNCGAQTYPLNQGTTSFSSTTASPRQVGWEFTCSAANISVTHLSAILPDAVARTVSLYQINNQQLLAQAALPAGTAGQWRSVQLTTPVALTNGTNYVVCVFLPSGVGASWYYLSGSSPAAFFPSAGNIRYVAARWDSNSATTPQFPGTQSAGYQYGIADIGYTTGPSLTVAAVAGTAQNVYANDTGSGGNGIVAGRFTVASNSQTGASLN